MNETFNAQASAFKRVDCCRWPFFALITDNDCEELQRVTKRGGSGRSDEEEERCLVGKISLISESTDISVERSTRISKHATSANFPSRSTSYRCSGADEMRNVGGTFRDSSRLEPTLKATPRPGARLYNGLPTVMQNKCRKLTLLLLRMARGVKVVKDLHALIYPGGCPHPVKPHPNSVYVECEIQGHGGPSPEFPAAAVAAISYVESSL
ncbi:hypothetical protein HN011_006267 [Eciton burchellii]|nr:hypothetical protein HN011_006267 [Eciton burchellii]